MRGARTSPRRRHDLTLISSMGISFSAKSVSANFSRSITEKLRLKSNFSTCTRIRTHAMTEIHWLEKLGDKGEGYVEQAMMVIRLICGNGRAWDKNRKGRPSYRCSAEAHYHWHVERNAIDPMSAFCDANKEECVSLFGVHLRLRLSIARKFVLVSVYTQTHM